MSQLLFIQYAKCSTCQKAKAWLDRQGADYIDRPIKEETPTYEELDAWTARSGLPLKRFFNTSSKSYQALGLKDRLPQLSREEQLRLLAADGMLIKRPLLIGEGFVLPGFKPQEWEAALSAEVSKGVQAHGN